MNAYDEAQLILMLMTLVGFLFLVGVTLHDALRRRDPSERG